MKRIIHYFVASAALLFCWTPTEAQVVMKLPEMNKAAESNTGQLQKATPNKAKAEMTTDYKSPWSLQTADEENIYSEFIKERGNKPALFAPPIIKSPSASNNKTMYTYTGFNAAAGTDDNGNSIGGMVNFNLLPFACDTVSSDPGLTPYSYVAKGKLYSFTPVFDPYSSKYKNITRTIYDANTLEVLSTKTVDNPTGSSGYVPYLITYDDQRDIVYAISMEDTEDRGYGGTNYYLNILDTATCKLQRLGYLGSYWSYKNKGNYSPKSLVAGYGTLYVQLSDDSIYMAKIDPNTCKTTIIGRTSMPSQYVFGLQPMVYDANEGSLLVNHYDFTNGTVYYKVSPFVPYGAKEDTCKTELVEKAPTGFTYFYKRPEAGTHSFVYQMDDINDLVASIEEGSNDVNLSFTIPSTADGGNSIDIPSWSSNKVRLYFYVDGASVTPTDVPAQPTLGSKVNCNITGLSSGMHIITVQVYPMYNELGGGRYSKTIVCGYDAPADVLNPNLTIENRQATITWNAPEKGLYDDFGSVFDKSDITYTVIRDIDGKVVAEDITETTATDTELYDEILTYTYTIYAKSHGNANRGTKTNSVSAGIYMPMPYVNTFTNATDLDGWTIYNLNNDGTAKTWQYNSIQGILVCSGTSGCDDWIMSPSFEFKTDSLYMLSYQLRVPYETASMKTTMGTGVKVEDQTIIIDDLYNFETEVTETKRYYITPEKNGYYNFGLHDYGVEMSNICIDTLIVKAIAPIVAPDSVAAVNFVPDAAGALGGTFTFTLPSKSIDGKQISELTKVTIYDLKGNALATKTDVRPGEQVTLQVKAAKGFNTYSIVAANANGEGRPMDITKYVGPDVPKPITDLKTCWGEEQNIALLSWTNPTEGVHGGYVDPANFKYTIYKYDVQDWPTDTKLGETTGESEVEIQIMDASEEQEQYVFSVTVSNEEGESDYVRSGLVMGTPYTLPYNEAFTEVGIDHAPYLLGAGINNQTWTIDPGYYNAKIQPYGQDGAQLLCLNTGSSEGSAYFISPIIDFEKTEKPMFSFWLHHSDAMPETAYIKVMASTDGSKNYVDISKEINLTGNNGWQEHIVDLSALNGKKAQISLYGYMPNPAVRIFADNWSIYEASGKDLAVTGITQPYMPVVGDTATISVTVVNKGANEATGYSVLFNVDDMTIDEIDPEEALAAGASRTFTFTLPITAAKKNILYNAQVLYDGDQNEENNLSSDVELDPRSMNLPAPTSLTLSNDDELAWTAPEAMDGREVMLDFESLPAFATNEIAGWKTLDKDGNLSTTFVQYYGNYWPYANQPLAWMTWSAKEAGCPDAAMWTPYEGEKCLIHWGNYGADAEGRPNNNPDDDWFISPEIKGGTEISFMTLSNDATSSIEILTSSTDDKPESFTNKVTVVEYPTISTWKEVKATLPADAKYVAIHTILDGFGIMIDNIAYTEAKAPVLKGYKLYLDNAVNSLVATNSAKATANGTYAVSAVYDLGESDLSNTVSVTTGIADLQTSDVKVMAGNGCIIVKNAIGQNVEVFTLNGQKVAGSVAGETATYQVAKGVYVVMVSNKPYKLIVK